MATAEQITANRLNAQASTGPKTEAGKAAVARNAVSHGLTSRVFAFLPCEDPNAFAVLLAGLENEHEPATPSESFLVLELARAQWKIERAAAIESELLAGDSATDWAAVAAGFRKDSTVEHALLKLTRYEQAARRTWHQSLNQLLKLRSAAETSEVRRTRAYRNEMEGLIHQVMNAPIPMPPKPETPVVETKPMPVHLQRELDNHKRRDPLFDPRMDASQMSRELQRYFEKHGPAAR
jgi:hypothetical protein